MIKVGIVGGAGYTAGELLRILFFHPEVEVTQVVSQSQVGKSVYEIHQDLLGITQLPFSEQLNKKVDVIFLCQGHGQSQKYLDENIFDDEIKIIDLSQDFRHQENSKMDGREFVFGLPELNSDKISSASSIANPGCFATAITLGLLPLAQANQLAEEVQIHALTGSTGAGQSLSETSHFSYRNNNVSIYKPFEHQHLKEIKESLNTDAQLNFIPVRGAFTRGIFASMYMPAPSSLEDVKKLYKSFFQNAPFTHVSDQPIHLKQVVNTNNCFIHLAVIDGKLLITSIIDNLLKGASGQAVQNMNLMFGLEETTGLKLKGSFF